MALVVFKKKQAACQRRSHKRRWFDCWVWRIPWGEPWHPLQYSLLENLHSGAWQATVHWGCTESVRHDWDNLACTVKQRTQKACLRLSWFPVVRNPLASGGDPGSVADWGRFHMLGSSKARGPQLPRLLSTTRETTAVRSPALQPETAVCHS